MTRSCPTCKHSDSWGIPDCVMPSECGEAKAHWVPLNPHYVPKISDKERELMAEVERLDASWTQALQERDNCEDIIDRLCDVVLGVDQHEWSSLYDFDDAVDDVSVKVAVLDEEVEELYRIRTELTAAQADAARYRWLRDHVVPDDANEWMRVALFSHSDENIIVHKELDDAIDSCMKGIPL